MSNLEPIYYFCSGNQNKLSESMYESYNITEGLHLKNVPQLDQVDENDSKAFQQ